MAIPASHIALKMDDEAIADDFSFRSFFSRELCLRRYFSWCLTEPVCLTSSIAHLAIFRVWHFASVQYLSSVLYYCQDSCFLLLARVIAVTFCVTSATYWSQDSIATPMAAFQFCLQFWMASSLLSDGLAIAGQVTYPTSHQHATWSLDDLPRIVACTMHQGSAVTSMDFHPSHHTLLLAMMVFDQ
ncbi:Protein DETOXIFICATION 43 [Camellia lanceoleosa]|uniref:Protein DETOXIFICATION 43 n=1 Tax=Camellia lanceoleosa TaxID=1840588 RepID=A0ACC0HXM9_9ERIC|nr:Protein DETOXIFICATION 43 [Camellia lanceoleosa]